MNPLNLFFAATIRLVCLWLLVGTATFAQEYKGFRAGRYQGQAYNKTGNTYGKATLDIRSIGTTGAVQAYLRDSDGLEGEGALTGAINGSGVLQLSGPMTSPSDKSVWQSALMAVMQNGQIRMGNRLTLGNAVQEETATMAFAGGNAPASARVNQPVQALTGIGAAYGARNPRTCASAPVSGPLSAQQAIQYVICGYEREYQGNEARLFLVDNIKLDLGGGRPYQAGTDFMTDADVRSPVYPIRGSYDTYMIDKLYTGPEPSWRNAGKNCNIYLNRPFTGKCYRTTFGDWSCLTTAGGSAYPDIANTTPPVR